MYTVFGQGKDEVGEGWGRLGKGREKSGNKSSDLKNLWYLNFKWGAARGYLFRREWEQGQKTFLSNFRFSAPQIPEKFEKSLRMAHYA